MHAESRKGCAHLRDTALMISTKSVRVLVGLLCLLLWPAPTVAQLAQPAGAWERHIDAGAAAYQQGNYAEAVKQTKAALSLAEAFAPDDPRLATTLNNLGEFYRAQGKYTEAEPLYKRALAIYEKALGPEHPHVAVSLNNLGEFYRAQGRYAEAEPLLKRALAIVEKALGPDHPNVATSLENYATLLRKTRRTTEAAKLEARAKAIRAQHAKENPGG